jgi:branched-chain amino acid transport system permease protein
MTDMNIWVEQIIQVLISGIVTASVYAIMGIGLSIIYGISRVFNFAYGSFFTWGAYLAWFLFSTFSWMTYPIVFLIVLPVMFGLGMLTERVVVRSLRWRPNWQVTTMMVTLGLAFFLDNLALIVFGGFAKPLPPMFRGGINPFGFTLSGQDLLMLIIGAIVMIVFGLFLSRSYIGMSMQAISQDMTGAEIVGIPIKKVFSYTFGLSTALVGMGGILLAPRYYISPYGGWEPFFRVFVVVAFGGLGSIRGTLYSALILAIFESFISWSLGATWVLPFWFLVFLGVLAFRPSGLMGKWG